VEEVVNSAEHLHAQNAEVIIRGALPRPRTVGTPPLSHGCFDRATRTNQCETYRTHLSDSAFITTLTELNAIAAAANIGCSHPAAATGTRTML
jgi:hypothetical protein